MENIRSLSIEEMESMEYNELMDILYNMSNKNRNDEVRERAREVLSRKSFNGRMLEEGDEIIIIFGKGLRNSVVEHIREGIHRRIKIKGLKNPVSSNVCIK